MKTDVSEPAPLSPKAIERVSLREDKRGQGVQKDKFWKATTSTENSTEEGEVEMIRFEERVISALNRTRPPGVVTRTGRERGKEVSGVVVKTRGLELTPNSEFKFEVEAGSESTEATTESMLCVSYVGSISTPDVSAGRRV